MILEVISTITIVGIVVTFLNPTHLTMPDTIVSMLTLLLIIAFLVFASFIWKEKGTDERETAHIMRSGRLSFLAGAAVLVYAIIQQSLTHEVDPWLVITLCAMVITKLLARIYHHFKM